MSSSETQEPEVLLNAETFQPHLETSFELRFDDGSEVHLELVEVSAMEHLPRTTRTPFSLLFRGPQEPSLQQAAYHMQHGELGQLLLFLVPVQSDAEGTDYEAVFS